MKLSKDDVVLRDVLDHAVGLPPEAREEYLASACGTDAEMLTRLTALLEALDEAGEFLADPTVEAGPPRGEVRKHGSKIDRYELLEPMGEGGMGTVYRARQLRPVRREVALKVIKLGMDTRRVIGRFEAERQALAMMDHPSIAKVLDAGATETGRPFFVMELVRGVRVTDYCDQNLLTLRERLGLFVQVCHAVQHAHQKGIIHRDLKPGNVLVTMQDGEPVPKIIDFGIAKATSQQLTDTESTLFTEMSQLLGTPMYMSPEQVVGGGNIDTRVDVYALGVLLYELLTGQTPFDRKRLAEAPREELGRIICQEAPPRPSVRVATAGETASKTAKLRAAEPRGLAGALRGDLDWMVMRCLEKDRSRRYDTANALARDVERYLKDEPVEASPPSTLYRLTKFVHRHRTALTAGGVAVALLITATGVSVRQAVRATRAESAITVEKQRGDEQAKVAIDELRHSFDVQQTLINVILNTHPTAGSTGRDVSVIKLLRNAEAATKKYLKDRPDSQIDVDLALAEAFERLDDLDDAGPYLKEAYKLTVTQDGGGRSDKSVRIAARLSYYSDLEFARRTREEAEKRYGAEDTSTFRATHGLAHVMGDRALSGLYRTEELHRAQQMMREVIDRINALPVERRPPETYQYMNQLAVLLNDDRQYAEGLRVVEEAMRRGAADGSLSDGARASLGFSRVEALRGLGRLDEAVNAARATYEFDVVTIGTFDGRTDRMLRNYVKLLAMTNRKQEAAHVLNETYSRARAFFPGDNETVVDFLTTLARYLLDAGETELAIPQLVETARTHMKIAGNENTSRLLAREALFASLGSKSQPIDGGIRTQVFCELECMWRDHPEWMPASLTASPPAVSYRLSRWDGARGDGAVVRESRLDKPEPAAPEPGLYRLTVEVKTGGSDPLRQTMGVLVADWDTLIYEDAHVQPVDLLPSEPGVAPTQLISRQRVAAVATSHLFEDPPEPFSQVIRMRGTTRVTVPSGRYRLSASTVDGIRLLVDGRVAINSWSAHRPRRDVRDLELDEGPHELRFDSFQRGRRRQIWIRMEPVLDPHHPVDPPLRGFERAMEEQQEMKSPEADATGGTLLAHAGRYPEALARYGKSLGMDSGQPFCWGQTELLYLLTNNPAAARGSREKLLGFESKGDRYDAARVAVVALSDAESKVDPGVGGRLEVADVGSAPAWVRGECQLARGLAAYRSGRFDEAAAVLAEAGGGRLTPEAKTTARVFHAMAVARAGDAGRGRVEFQAAVKAAEAFPTAGQVEMDPMEVQDRLICQLAVLEAGKIFGGR